MSDLMPALGDTACDSSPFTHVLEPGNGSSAPDATRASPTTEIPPPYLPAADSRRAPRRAKVQVMTHHQGRHAARRGKNSQHGPQTPELARASHRAARSPEVSRGERGLAWLLVLLSALAEVLAEAGIVLAQIAVIITLISSGPGR